MKIYFAVVGDIFLQRLKDMKAKHALFAYCFMNYKNKHTDIKKKYNLQDLFMDSGAFVANSQGIFINIEQYMYYCKMMNTDVYANLDVIGNPESTYQNQLKMEKKGLNPLPCFHYGEDFKWLKLYCENYDYIGLGGIASGGSRNEFKRWLTYIFNRFPKMKFHGYGMTIFKLMKEFNWYSVDSTAYRMCAAMGNIYTPYGGFYISDRKGKNVVPERIKKYIESQKFNIDELRVSDKEREKINIKFIMDFEENWSKPKSTQSLLLQDLSQMKVSRNEPNLKYDSHKQVRLSMFTRVLKTKYLLSLYEIECAECSKKLFSYDKSIDTKECTKCGSKLMTTLKETEKVIWL